jgi:hypothetical protein
MEAITKSRMFCLYWQVIESSGKDQTDSGDAIRVSVLVCTAILRYLVCSKSKCVENIVIYTFVFHLEFGGPCWVRKNYEDRGRRGTFK